MDGLFSFFGAFLLEWIVLSLFFILRSVREMLVVDMLKVQRLRDPLDFASFVVLVRFLFIEIKAEKVVIVMTPAEDFPLACHCEALFPACIDLANLVVLQIFYHLLGSILLISRL